MAGRLTWEQIEALVTGRNPNALLSQAQIEALVTGRNPNALLSQVQVEVMVSIGGKKRVFGPAAQ